MCMVKLSFMIDSRYILLAVMVFIVFVILRMNNNDPRGYYQIQDRFDGDYEIRIDEYLHNRFVDLILKYAMDAKPEDRAVMIYMITFQLFNLNFHHKRLEHLDAKLSGSRLNVKNIQFPSWSKYTNLQTAIANTVYHELINTERVFAGNAEQNRKMIDIYLNTLLDRFDIKRI